MPNVYVRPSGVGVNVVSRGGMLRGSRAMVRLVFAALAFTALIMVVKLILMVVAVAILVSLVLAPVKVWAVRRSQRGAQLAGARYEAQRAEARRRGVPIVQVSREWSARETPARHSNRR